MSIATKKGDFGKTYLFSGERVEKDDLRVEAYGTGDELISHLAELKFYAKDFKDFIEEVQKIIFKINANLASTKLMENYFVSEEDMDFLDKMLADFEMEFGKLKSFIIPSETLAAAKCDVCRTVCRRFERRVVALSKDIKIDKNILKFINRLSDCLFMLARVVGKREGGYVDEFKKSNT
ncbi:cob(I)yrinic acid a,c-diamide adenosyltransferase [Deferribacter autotrophicus]|uniref:Corrinoid adenosyltransferase n=1 Tax=Deferribacter autotrophicus TaxID=500465 RepID=A0A5A8F2Q2_9BACT|nr:cob(I)yrinic acid a,c-diamide adenosyltransferase [Deferribacter autotrophicus]KAA0258083.1 cob(I)yrinic acid a,c-diamide adenosyltransferase [Deferribacter autotrophicus]